MTHFVAGLGTSGHLPARPVVCAFNPGIEAISMQPDSLFNGLEGLKHMPTALKPGIYDEFSADENIEVRTEDAYQNGAQNGTGSRLVCRCVVLPPTSSPRSQLRNDSTTALWSPFARQRLQIPQRQILEAMKDEGGIQKAKADG